jgi:hypothetical protein
MHCHVCFHLYTYVDATCVDTLSWFESNMYVYIYLHVDMDIDDHSLHFIHFLPYVKEYNAIGGWSGDREAGGHINVMQSVCYT